MTVSLHSLTRRFVAVAATVASVALLALATAQEDAPAPAGDGTVETASYGLFPVEGSGVRAHLQVSSNSEGGIRLVLTASGIEPGEELAAALYQGDCGPDRPLLVALTPVGASNDPYVSITGADLSFMEVTGGDHFAYLFAENAIDRPEESGLDVQPLACGEVGEGANR